MSFVVKYFKRKARKIEEGNVMTQNEEIILIDGNSLINRAFYGVPPLTTKAGEPAGAVYGFTNMLIKLIESHSPSYIAVAFDMKAKTFRHLAYDG